MPSNIVKQIPRTSLENILELVSNELSHDVNLFKNRINKLTKSERDVVLEKRVFNLQKCISELEKTEQFELMRGKIEEEEVLISGPLNLKVSVPLKKGKKISILRVAFLKNTIFSRK